MHFSLICLLLLLLSSLQAAPATTDQTNLPDAFAYSRRVWRSTDGLPEDFAQSIAQTHDGYLWIGTSGGLVRFDGTSFVVFNRENEPAFLDDSVYSLFVSHDNALWIGTEGGGLIRYQKGSFKTFGAADGITNGFVRVIFEDKAHRIWVGTDSGLFRMQNESFIRVDDQNGIPRMGVHTICEDKSGRLLIGGRGLLVLSGDRSEYFTSNASEADNSIRTIRQTMDGTLWIGTISGLRRIDPSHIGNPFLVPKLLSNINISFLLVSRTGQLWIGSYGQGVLRYEAGRISKFTAPNLLPHNNVLALFEDNEDDVWVGTQGGLLRLSPSIASTIAPADGVPQSINTIYQDPHGDLFVTALNGQLFRVVHQTLVPAPLPSEVRGMPIRNVFRDSRGALWLGTDGQGAVRINESGITRYTMQQGLISDFIRAFCEDRDGSLWIGTDGGLSRFSNNSFQNFNVQNGLAYNSVRTLLLDRSGSLWVATDGGISRFQAGALVNNSLLTGLRGKKIWALHDDQDGGFWIGTHGAGLYHLKNGTLAQFTTKVGLPSNKIHFITEDARGNLWMSGPSGIVSVSRRELESLSRNASGQLAVRVYTTAEGLSTHQMNGGVQPAGALLASGELWFPSTRGAVRLLPDGASQRNAPPVLIERAIADDHDVSFSDELTLAPGRGNLEIHYTAIRLRAPDRIRFKYWMENFDPGWIDAGQRRVAYYTNLPAGKYRFHVVAYETDDPRNATEKSLTIEWRPHFYETRWFLALCALAAASIAWIWYKLHVRNIRQRFAAVLDERTRLAREMHDTLIQGCVGVSALLEAASSAREVSPSISDELLDRARNEVRATVDEARLAVWNLRQGEGEGLVSAISKLCQQTERESGIAVLFESSGSPLALTAESERSLLMVIREALQNAVRHAAPSQILVRASFDAGTLRVEINDNGRGFDTAQINSSNNHHYGLIGMRERVEKMGGSFFITSIPSQGTHIKLSIPVSKFQAQAKP